MITLHIETNEHAEAIIDLLIQGIEIELLRLEIQHCTNSDSIESRIKIIQGKQFVSLLIAASSAG